MTEAEARALVDRLGTFLERFAPCFGHRRKRTGIAAQYVRGLLNDSERKSMQAMHARLSDADSYEALQHFITDSPWDVEAIWTTLRAGLPERAGVLMLDETSFPKYGTHSVGVAHQYCGALGKLANCQVAVSTALLAAQRAWPTTLELYLPEAWDQDEGRRHRADVPAEVRHRPKWELGLAQIERVLAAGIRVTGVVADTDYGRVGPFRDRLDALGLRYAVSVRNEQSVVAHGARYARRADETARRLPAQAWHRVTWAQGVKGPLVARFAAIRVRPVRHDTECWLLCQRPIGARGEWKFYFSNLPPSASLKDLVVLARSRWPIEQQYRDLKDELGLDHFEGRSYVGWTHHAALAAIAFTFIQLERRRGRSHLPTFPQVRNLVREIMLVLYLAARPDLTNLIVSFRRNPPLRN